MQVELTPGATTTVDANLLLTAPEAPGLFRQDPWATAAAQLPAVAAGAPMVASTSATSGPASTVPPVCVPPPGVPATFDQLQLLFQGSEHRIQQNFKAEIGGLEGRLGQRITTVETAHNDLVQEVRSNKAEIDTRFGDLQAQLKKAHSQRMERGTGPQVCKRALCFCKRACT